MFIKKASKGRGDTIALMVKILESRLDVVVYRLKFAITPQAARQLVSHGHVLVNGQKVDRPSYQVQLTDEISLAPRSKDIQPVQMATTTEERDIPPYVECDTAKRVGRLSRIPELAEVPYPVQMDFRLVIEYYSR